MQISLISLFASEVKGSPGLDRASRHPWMYRPGKLRKCSVEAPACDAIEHFYSLLGPYINSCEAAQVQR